MTVPGPTRPTIVHIGRVRANAQGWWNQIQAWSDVVAFPTMELALLAPLPQSPRVAILLQNRDDEHSPEALAAWLTRFPLCRCVCLLGPWVSGRIPHQARSWGCPTFAWHQIPTLKNRLTDYLSGHSSWADWPCASPAEQLLGAWHSTPIDADLLLPPLWVATRQPEIRQALTRLFRIRGLATFSAPTFPHAEQMGIGLYHIASRVDWSQHAAWDYCRPRIALVDFPDPHERHHLQSAGYDDVLPWPFHYPDLLTMLQHSFRRSRTLSPS